MSMAPPHVPAERPAPRNAISDLKARLGELRGDASAIRDAAVPVIREHLAAGRKQVEEKLIDCANGEDGWLHGWGGRVAATALSDLTDEVVAALHDLACRALPCARIAVAASGGYGRGRMAPGSDVDLLFVVEPDARADGEAIAEWMLYALWDLKLKVGHATRTPAECAAMAGDDHTVRTALLEARHIAGDPDLTAKVIDRIYDDLSNGAAAEFARAKLAEREERLKRVGPSRYAVEPDVKEGKGGQRDLQALFWIAKAVHGVRRGDDLLGHGIFTGDEYARFRAAEDFQWAVRCHLHFERGRAVEKLSFDLQPAVAERMGFGAHDAVAGAAAGDGRAPVERFMRTWFRIAKDVGDLTRILCAQLEARHLKPAGRGFIGSAVDGVVGGVVGAARRLGLAPATLPAHERFRVRDGRLDLVEGATFVDHPIDLIRLFHIAEVEGLPIHPDALTLVTRSLDLIDDGLRVDAEANRLFVAIVASRRDPENTLRHMNEAGVLGAFVPPFQAVVAMMQFSMYHHYTVDEHLVRTVGVLAEIARGDPHGKHPLAVRLVPALRDYRALAVACLIHDIAKGREEDHSIAGAREAEVLCPRLGLDERETALVSWLIAEHLTMSMVAQTRDISDPRTIRDLVARVGTRERLDTLLVLTVCDIRAVGPGVWNGWKGQLLRTLHAEAAAAMEADAPPPATREREAREALVNALVRAGWNGADAARHAALHARPYLLAVPLEDQLRRAAFVRAAGETDETFRLESRTSPFEGVTEIAVLAPDHPRLFAILTGACAACGANIAGARIDTMADGRALDILQLTRDFTDDEDELRRASRIERNVVAMLKGERRLGAMVGERRARPGVEAFSIEPRVTVSNELSDRHTVIEIEARDRPGLLSDVATALGEMSLDLASAQLTTFGEKAVDSFYVTDLMGGKVASAERIKRIETMMLAALKGEDTPPRAASTAGSIAERA